MAAAPISRILKNQRQQLLDDLNYLNAAEIKKFCRRHAIPYTIVMQTKGGRRKTQEDDRKGVMLGRVRHFLKTGAILKQTCPPAEVICLAPLRQEIGAPSRLHYGQYDKRNRNITALLKDLTAGHYRDGAIARILMQEFW